MSIKATKNKNIPQPEIKRQRRSSAMSTEQLEAQIAAQLENARHVIDIHTSNLGPNFGDMVKLILTSSGLDVKSIRKKAGKFFKAGKRDEVIDFMIQVHGFVSGKTIKSSVTNFIKALNLEDSPMETEESEDDSSRLISFTTPFYIIMKPFSGIQ